MRQLPARSRQEAPSLALAAGWLIPHAPSHSPPPQPSLGTGSSTQGQRDRTGHQDTSAPSPLEGTALKKANLNHFRSVFPANSAHTGQHRSLGSRSPLVFAPGRADGATWSSKARQFCKAARLAETASSTSWGDHEGSVRSELASHSPSLAPPKDSKLVTLQPPASAFKKNNTLGGKVREDSSSSAKFSRCPHKHKAVQLRLAQTWLLELRRSQMKRQVRLGRTTASC